MDITAAIGEARRAAGMTAAEFDYSLSIRESGLGSALHYLAEAIGRQATAGMPVVTTGDSALAAAKGSFAAAAILNAGPEIDALIAAAQAKKYTGWSNEGPTQYAR